jgi:hypothetical protein
MPNCPTCGAALDYSSEESMAVVWYHRHEECASTIEREDDDEDDGWCCDGMESAIEFGFVEIVDAELTLVRRTLTEVNPDATAGNVLTGETYDPSEFTMTLALSFCPWCAHPLTRMGDPYEVDPDEVAYDEATQ